MLRGLGKEPTPWNFSSGGVTRPESHTSNRATLCIRHNQGWMHQCGSVKVTVCPQPSPAHAGFDTELIRAEDMGTLQHSLIRSENESWSER